MGDLRKLRTHKHLGRLGCSNGLHLMREEEVDLLPSDVRADVRRDVSPRVPGVIAPGDVPYRTNPRVPSSTSESWPSRCCNTSRMVRSRGTGRPGS